MQNFTIRAKALVAVLPHVSKELSRIKLNGIGVLANGHLAGTDGTTLALYRDGHTSPTELILSVSPEVVKIAKNAVKKAKASKIGETDEIVVQMGEEGSRNGTFSAFGLVAVVSLIEGPYPNPASVFPKDESKIKPIDGISLDPELLARFGDRVALSFQSEMNAMIVRTQDVDFAGLIMPLRKMAGLDEDRTVISAWVHAPADAVRAASAKAS